MAEFTDQVTSGDIAFAQARRNNLEATTDPTVNDDIGDGYVVGSLWMNQTADTAWLCFDSTAGAAAWQLVSYNAASLLALLDGYFLTPAEGDAAFLTPAEGDAAYQPLNATLTALALLTTTAYGRGLLSLADATALAALVDSFFLTPTEGNAAYQPLDGDLTALSSIAAGLAVKTAANTWLPRSVAVSGAGLGVSNGDGVSGNPTLALADDVAAIEAQSSTGLLRRTGTNTWDLVSDSARTRFWVRAGVSGNILQSFNVTSVTDDGPGVMTVTIATDFSNSNWAPGVAVENSDASIDNLNDGMMAMIANATIANGTVQVLCKLDDGAAAADPASFSVWGWGDQ